MKFVGSAALAAALTFAAGPTAASTGQCYNADGNPTGPAYVLAAPDTTWIRYVKERGGRCTGVEEAAEDPQPRLSPHEVPHHRHFERHRQTRRY